MSSRFNQWLSRPLFQVLEQFHLGILEMTLPDGTVRNFGSGENGPEAKIIVKDDDFFRRCTLYGNVGLGEAWIDGQWETPDIRAVIEWFARNVAVHPKARGSSSRLSGVGLLRLADKVQHRFRRNSKTGSRRNIEEHYDLGNDFYKIWLDPTMTYSSACFQTAEETLEQAQGNKYDALCKKLMLKPTDHVLEIGCGWGGFSIHVATKYGCKVTGVTISPSQHEEAVKRVKAAGLEHLIDIRLQDYRDIDGQFDKIASIEMLEAVGDQFLETWTRKVNEVLKPNGLVAVQVITVPDISHKELRKGTDFIQKHIFPGSLLLSVARLNEAFNKTSDLFLHALEDIGTSYRRTLEQWHDNFNERLDDIRAQGFNDRFIRKWNYYLKYCEAGFATRSISVVQGVFTRPDNGAILDEKNGIARSQA